MYGGRSVLNVLRNEPIVRKEGKTGKVKTGEFIYSSCLEK
jgi:hypothetical protein